jgi:hypothetical protein
VNGFKKGEVRAAANVLRDRLDAACGDEAFVAEVNIKSGDMRGDSFPFLGVYSDLVDVGEVIAVSQGPVNAYITDIALGTEPDIALRSMYLLAVAHGVLIERARRAT